MKHKIICTVNVCVCDNCGRSGEIQEIQGFECSPTGTVKETHDCIEHAMVSANSQVFCIQCGKEIVSEPQVEEWRGGFRERINDWRTRKDVPIEEMESFIERTLATARKEEREEAIEYAIGCVRGGDGAMGTVIKRRMGAYLANNKQ